VILAGAEVPALRYELLELHTVMEVVILAGAEVPALPAQTIMASAPMQL